MINNKRQVFKKVNINSIKPTGWILEHLKRQKSGLTGNIEAAGYPYNTRMWASETMDGSSTNEFDISWWPYEQTGYYLDGAYRLAKLINDEELIELVESNIDYVMDHLDKDGRISTPLSGEWWRWPYAVFNKLFMLEYEEKEELKYLDILRNHYSNFTAKDFSDDLELTNVEELCWIYSHTGEKKYLEIAEEAYKLFKSDYSNRDRADSELDFSSDRVPDHHGVVYIELLKIPVMLYMFTGNEAYLKEAINGAEKMENHFMLISGLPSTTEHFREVSEISAHETCNTATFPYTYGIFIEATGNANYSDKIEKAIFNAAFGSITKDFKSHQYFSAPNQVISILKGQNFGYHDGMSAYLPGHHVECCTGNVNRFMPYYVEQMWMKDKNNNPVLSLYGPSIFKSLVGKGNDIVEITQKTNYPFDNRVELIIQTEKEVEFSLKLRIPKWSKNTKVYYNENRITNTVPGEYLSMPSKYNNNDRIIIEFDMSIQIIDLDYGIGFMKGPIVYSLPIVEEKSHLENYSKQSSEFKAYNRYPVSEWKYAISLKTLKKIGIVEKQTNASGYPFDLENITTVLQIPVKRVKNIELEYQMINNEEFIETPKFSKHLEVEDGYEIINLVPYGSTTLRLTVFPKVN